MPTLRRRIIIYRVSLLVSYKKTISNKIMPTMLHVKKKLNDMKIEVFVFIWKMTV